MDPKQLREETRTEHETTEALLSLGHSDLRPKEYAAGLAALQPTIESWEAWAAVWAPGDLGALVQARRRGHLLRADLHALGADGSESSRKLPHADWMTVVTGATAVPLAMPDPEVFAAGFLGAMYVVEGSTLGGRFLARHVTQVLGAAYEPATQYLSGHRDQTGAMWREITGRIAAIPDALAGTTVAAAKRAFGVFGEGLRVGLSPASPGPR